MTGRAWLAALAACTLLPCGVAHADPDDDTIDQPDLNGVVCDQTALGQTPGQIADALRRGNPTLPAGLPFRVFQDVQDCP